jgi:hypothetical protein
MKSKLEELKATAAKLQQQIEELEKPKPWEPRGGKYWVNGAGGTSIKGTTNASRKFGLEYQTEAESWKAAAAMSTHNRLLAYVDEFGGEWVADWSDSDEQKYVLRYNNEIDTWAYSSNQYLQVACAVYMSKECAEGLIVKLNSGEVSL